MLPRLQAERQLAAIEASSFPDIDAKGRRDVLKKYEAALGLERQKPARPTEAELAALGITVEHVTADGLPVAQDTTGRDEEVGHVR
jgi:hypothetical protein